MTKRFRKYTQFHRSVSTLESRRRFRSNKKIKNKLDICAKTVRHRWDAISSARDATFEAKTVLEPNTNEHLTAVCGASCRHRSVTIRRWISIRLDTQKKKMCNKPNCAPANDRTLNTVRTTLCTAFFGHKKLKKKNRSIFEYLSGVGLG